MTDLAFFAVLIAAVMHAGWNALVKINAAPLLAISAMFGCICVLVLPYTPWLVPLPISVWPLLALSLAFHFGYKYHLVKAYNTGNFSQAYPIARGSAPIWVLLLSLLLFPQELSVLQASGVLITVIGIVSLASWRQVRANHQMVRAAMITGFWIAGYTLLDGYLVAQPVELASYLFWLFLLDGLIINAYAAFLARGDLLKVYQKHWRVGMIGGAFSLAAYGICLWAMTHIPIAMVSALRETSVLVAVAIAVMWLNERTNTRQWVAAILITVGLVVQKVG